MIKYLPVHGVSAPSCAWVGDMTFIRHRQGWLHLAIPDYVECLYNQNRIHQSLGYRTPDELEMLYYGA